MTEINVDLVPRPESPTHDKRDADGESSAADELVRLVEAEGVVLFHDPDLITYATFDRDGARQTWPVDSQELERYLRWLYYQHEGKRKSPRVQAVKDALATLAARAQFDGPMESVSLRLAAAGEAIYLDLTDAEWRAIRIDRDGWSVVHNPPVRFRRSSGMRPLPVPKKGGSVEELRQFINVASDDDWRLVVAWILSALRPPMQPFPILTLYGEQGSAKSTTSKVIRNLIDPNQADLRAMPRGEQDLAITANASWVFALDNLSGIKPEQSDWLCRLSTGGGFSTRKLYTDDEERIFDILRPIILNGIEELGSRSDLLDRSLLITLPLLPASRRKTNADVMRAFEAAQPRILGALLDATAQAIRTIDSVQLTELPRMADFLLWGTAAEPALGWPAGSLKRAYLEQIAAIYAKQRSNGIAPWTISGTHTILSGLFRLALTRGYIATSPLDRLAKIEKPKQIAEREARRLSDEEVRKLCAAATATYRPIITTLAWTGMRVSEALGLRWEDVDFDAKEIRVHGQLTEDGTIKRPKTKAGSRTVPLLPVVEHELREYRKTQLARGLVGSDRLVFTTAQGKPLNRHNVRNKGIGHAADKAGLHPEGATKITTHDLRRTFISHLILGLGLDPVRVSKIAGHSNVSVTLNTYSDEFDKAMHRDDLFARIEKAGFGSV